MRRNAIIDTIKSEERTNSIQKREGLTNHPVRATVCQCSDPNCGAWHDILTDRALPTSEECDEILKQHNKENKMCLDTVELLMAIEEEFEIKIDDNEAANCTTPEHVAAYIHSQLKESEKDIIIKCIIEITSIQLGIPIKEINKDSNFVKDFEAD